MYVVSTELIPSISASTDISTIVSKFRDYHKVWKFICREDLRLRKEHDEAGDCMVKSLIIYFCRLISLLLEGGHVARMGELRNL
jgi:hypothetical protein